MRSHALYTRYHPHYLWNGIHHISLITTTLLMVSDQLYVWHHTHFTDASLCTVHVTSTLYDFKPLYLSHYIHCIHDITHPIYDITHMAVQTLYLPSDPLYLTLHPLYRCHQKQGINYTTTTLCMISHRLYMWHHIQYACYQSNCLWHHTPLCDRGTHIHYTCDITATNWCHHSQHIYGIIYNTYAITILLSWQHNDYTWHLTHHIWHHSHCISVNTQMAHTSISMCHSIDDITTSV